MKKLLLILGCFAYCSAFGQLDNRKSIVQNRPDTKKMAIVTGYLKNAPDDSLVSLWDPYSGAVDTARTKNGRFRLEKLIDHGGSILIMKIGSKPDNREARVMYVEDGKMHIRGEGFNLGDATLSGDKWVEEWNEVWEILNPERPIWKSYNALEVKHGKALEVGDEDAAAEFDRQGDSIQVIYQAEMMKWIKKHPNSGVSVYLMSFFKDKKQRDEIFALLGDHAKDSRIYKRLKFPNKYDKVPGVALISVDNDELVRKGAIVPGAMAPEFNVPDENGKIVTLSQFRGKYVFVDFWASWCGPCKPQIPFLKAANEKFANSNFVMIAVSLDKDREAWQKAIKKHELNWVNLSSLQGWREPAAIAFNVSHVPYNVLIGPDGKVLAVGLLGDNVDKTLSKFIK